MGVLALMDLLHTKYYYPEHWNESQWERDFKQMHELGFEFTHFAEFASKLPQGIIYKIINKYRNYFELEDFAQNLGLLFQITDDILDEEGSFDKVGKTIGKDNAEDKLTFVKVYGLKGAKIQADLYASNCVTVLDALNGDVAFLRDLVGYVRTRDR